MGVHGLTAFLNENRRNLSYTLELTSGRVLSNSSAEPNENQEKINLVVDGWSFIYALFHDSGEPWVYGGEYAALSGHVEAIINAWTLMGIKSTFVFDGPAPPIKYPTVVSRLQDNCVRPANLFFRTSPAARSTPRSLAENRIAPPLGYQAIVSTLLNMKPLVQVEISDGEADQHVVSLAGRLGGYVAGNDSDFIVLNCEGYKGYIPLEDMTWIASGRERGVDSPDSSTLGENDELGFQTVARKERGRWKAREPRIGLGNGIVPPSRIQPDATLLLTVYEPIALAKHVSLPPSLLPLFGALIGNDYASFDFFRSSESAPQRVKRVADTLSSVLKEAQSGNARKMRKINLAGQDSVLDVIGTTVERLLIWRNPLNPPANGKVGEITEEVVQSTLEYTLDSQLLQEILDEDRNDNQLNYPERDVSAAVQIKRTYLHAYRKGLLHPQIMGIFTRGACFPRLFLEDPDRESCARSIGRPIREVIWSVLNESGGIPEPQDPLAEPKDDGDLQNRGSDEDDDELVDVAEVFSEEEMPDVVNDEDDPLAALRGKLQRLSISGSEEKPEPVDIPTPEPESLAPDDFVDITLQAPKTVTEYVRRGVRVVGEDLEVNKLPYFLPEYEHGTKPIPLRSMDERLRVFLQALGSDTHSIREIAAEEATSIGGGKLLLVLALRWVVQTLHTRAENSDSRDRHKEKWTQLEAQAFLSSLYEEEPKEQPRVDDRAVQLTAQILAALEACGWLAQALLLAGSPISGRLDPVDVRLPMRLGEAEKLFSGRKFHSALQSRPVSEEPTGRLWGAVQEGLEGMFAQDRMQRRRAKKDPIPANVSRGKNLSTTRFGILAALDIE